MKPKSVFIELLILFILIALVLLPFYFAGNATLDINLHDTYFVIRPFGLAYLSCLVVITMVYLIKEAFFKYRRRLPNIILVIAHVLLIARLLKSMVLTFAVTSAMSVNDGAPNNGWTIYPPLSKLSTLPRVQSDPLEHAGGELIYIINFFLLTLVIITFLTGKNWNTKHPDAEA